MPLIAKTKNDVRVSSLEPTTFNHDDYFSCPNCKEKMMFVDAIQKIKHFRHYALCPYDTEPETETHLAMKAFMKKLYPNAELEVRIGNRITDVMVGNIAIECQVSSISNNEILQRMNDYNTNGFSVCWILGNRNFGELKYDEVTALKYEKLLHRMFYGRVYYFINDEIYACHFYPVEREIEGNDYHEGYTKTLKRVKYPSLKKVETKTLFSCESNGYKIARFYDKAWWL